MTETLQPDSVIAVRRSRSKSQGQAMVEFALSGVLFFLLIGGALEGGRLIYSYLALNHAVQEGARTGVLAGKSVTDVRNRVVSAASPVTVSPGTVVVNATPNGFAARDLGDQLTVTATYTFTPVIGLVFGNGAITLTATSKMRVE
jgi:Flp pilus assembly protein TadG